ncbi:MAG: chromate transporter [Candidatus Acidiferrum sp.]
MSEPLDTSTTQTMPLADPAASPVTVRQIFLEFLLIGATSFGGGVVAYLRNGLITKRGWLGDKSFVELLSISQSLPGLNSTNMSILVGDRLRGLSGALAGILGMCLPGGLLMFAVGMVYREHGDHPVATAALKGVAAAAVGLILATAVQLGKRSLDHKADVVFVIVTILGVNRLHLSVLTVLLAVGVLATIWYHPHREQKQGVTS